MFFTFLEYKQQLTLMHIQMEMGRVTIMKRMERMINTQPHGSMTLSEFSKAARDKHKISVASMSQHLVSSCYICKHRHINLSLLNDSKLSFNDSSCLHNQQQTG